MTVCGNSTTWALLPVATCAATHNSVTPHETNSFGHSLALESMMDAILDVNAMFLRSCFFCDEICVAIQYLMRGWFLNCRLHPQRVVTSTYQLMPRFKFHHCSPGENLNVIFTNWRMAYKVLFSTFLYFDGYVQDRRNWDICYEHLTGPHVKVRKSI